MSTSRKYPIGIQTFEKIRTGNYYYVDKTALVHKLANECSYVFLARPRRFGKSLLLTTLQTYFEGRRELFDGLAMEHLETKWEKHPVILLSLSAYNPDNVDSLSDILDFHLKNWEDEYGIKNKFDYLSWRFRQVIESAYAKTGKKVVVLIDDYDAPMIAHMGEGKKYDTVRNLLNSVYINLKEMDAYIRFAMLSGVSHYRPATVFSGLNNLNDISMDSRYSDLCGFSENELRENFKLGISEMATALETDYEGAVTALKENYDGYHFTRNSVDIYNPFSLIYALSDSHIGSYWYASGTPSFLIKQIRRNPGHLARTFNERASERTLSDIDSFQSTPIPLMFQTGYLTVKSYDPRRNLYRLGIPNREVEEGLFNGLLARNMETDPATLMPRMYDIRDLLDEGNVDKALDMVKSFLAGIPYSLTNNKPELYFENNLYLTFKLLGIDTRAEWQTSDGRIDMLLETERYIYVMELKLDGSPEQALAQIDSKDYPLQFVYDNRSIIKVGINFSNDTRNIDSWLVSR